MRHKHKEYYCVYLTTSHSLAATKLSLSAATGLARVLNANNRGPAVILTDKGQRVENVVTVPKGRN